MEEAAVEKHPATQAGGSGQFPIYPNMKICGTHPSVGKEESMTTDSTAPVLSNTFTHYYLPLPISTLDQKI